MGQTIIEKLIARHTSEEVKPGKIVWMDLDVRSARDFGGANVTKNFISHYGEDRVGDKEKTFFTFDCNAPANTIPYAENQQLCRKFAHEQGIKLYDVSTGIGSHVLIEEGKVRPGGTVVGTDSHFNIMGAVGAFGQGMGDSDIAYAFRYGRTWFEVPKTIKVTLKGTPSSNATARDITFAVLRHFGSSGALGKAVEIYGEAVDSLNLSGRITLASQGTEIGAISILLSPSQELLSELEEICGEPVDGIEADKDAKYCEEHVIDVEGLCPLTACPPSPTNINEVSKLSDVKVNAVFIGSCTNGRYEDLKAASKILKSNTVAPGVNLFVVPSTMATFKRLLAEGDITNFITAGAVVSNPSCAGCASGQIGMTGTGEVMLSTSNRNYKGKQGNGMTYLVSPVTAALSAISGNITSL